MNQETLQRVVDEVGPVLTRRFVGKIFQLTPLSFAIDFGLRGGHFLFISSEPAASRLYLIKRRVKDLERESSTHSQFAQHLRSTLGGAALLNVTKEPKERVVRFSFSKLDDLGKTKNTVLIAQLTGRSANLFLLDEEERIAVSLRATKGPGQLIGTCYKPPQQAADRANVEKSVFQGEFESLSAALDSYYQRLELESSFQQRTRNIQSRLRQGIRQRLKLKENLERDLAAHGDAQKHKRLGDLLLANLATAERAGSKVLIRDFYSEGSPLIQVELDQDASLQEEATRCFARYGKAKRATEEIARRLSKISEETAELMSQEKALAKVIDEHDEEALAGFEKPDTHTRAGRSRLRGPAKIPGVRTYKSSDGYEILVGRAAADNDRLTFRVAKPNDLWLHSADYAGSHVIVRRLNRNDIPQRTIVEAAQLAARFSQASKDSKVVVHYTQRKFLSKPKGAAPGLVRMSRFKTILVEPKEAIERG